MSEYRCTDCLDTGQVWDPEIRRVRLCDCRAVQLPPPDTNPDGPAGIEDRGDEVRLNKQQARVWAVLKDEEWHTLPELCSWTGYPAQSISARIRDLRKQKYGGHTVLRQSMGGGLYRYRLMPNPDVLVKA